MGFGDFLSSAAGAIGSVGGAVLGGPLGSAIGGIAGGSISQSHADKKQFARDKYWYDQQTNTQKEFAKKGIQWKVADAKKAGIHPLAALGAQTYNASPAMIGGSPLSDHGSNMASMGQDIGRAITTQMSATQKKLMDLNLKNAQYDTEMKRLELVNKRRSLGQSGQTDAVDINPAQVTSHVKGRPNIEAGTVTNVGYAKTASGGLTPVPSKDVKERIEDQLIPETVWAAQNYIGPMVGKEDTKPPKKYLPKGAVDWQWSISEGAWMPVRKKGKTPWQRFKKWGKSVGESISDTFYGR